MKNAMRASFISHALYATLVSQESPIHSDFAAHETEAGIREVTGERDQAIAHLIGSTTTAVPYAKTSVTPCMTSVAS